MPTQWTLPGTVQKGTSSGNFDPTQGMPQPMTGGLGGYADWTMGGGGYQAPQDMNPQGEQADPFGYTQGSLLTPWGSQAGQQFNWTGGTPGGYSAPQISPFQFGQFGYNAPSVGRITPMQLQARDDFQAPDPTKISESPAYQFRLSEGMKALQNSAAAKGTLLSGATGKALQDWGQRSASQEYDNEYNRALQGYQTNLGKDFGVFDRNWGAQFGAGQANQNAALGEGALGFQVASGAWDRNLGLARQQWQDSADAANRAASAGASNSAADYNRAMSEYQMRRGEYWQNQDRQYNMLSGVAGMGQWGSGGLANAGSMYGQNLGSIYGQAANAQAAGQMGSGNAWAQGLGGAANAGLGAYYMNQYGNNGGGWQAPQPTGGLF